MKKLFTNDKFFLATVICAFIGEISFALINIFVWHTSIQSKIVLILRLLCVLALYVSYQKHSKNVMKGMMGALLMSQVISAILCISESQISTDYICYPVFGILSGFLFLNHFIINSDHKAKPGMVTINQIILVLLVINNTISGVSWMLEISNIFDVFASLLDIIGFAGYAAVVVCVESRLDAFRLDREAAGWTEEKGYPEGYVHEYEKKDNK